MIYYRAHQNENQDISMDEFKKIEDVVLYELKIRNISHMNAKEILRKIIERFEYQNLNDKQKEILNENPKDILIKRLEEKNKKLEDKECDWGNEKRELKYQVEKYKKIIALNLVIIVIAIILIINMIF